MKFQKGQAKPKLLRYEVNNMNFGETGKFEKVLEFKWNQTQIQLFKNKENLSSEFTLKVKGNYN